MDAVVYIVPGVSCQHCAAAVTDDVSVVAGVESVAVDLESRRVEIRGSRLDDAAIRAAIEAAGYEVS